MTFTEAAEAVLKQVGKPLPVKKITQLAIEQNLLSHVGKTPEVTMTTRLNTMTKKDRGDAAIIRVKPGVFALREWGLAPAPSEAEDTTEETAAEEAEAPAPAAANQQRSREEPRHPKGERTSKNERHQRSERTERAETAEKTEKQPAPAPVAEVKAPPPAEPVVVKVTKPEAPEKNEKAEKSEPTPAPTAASQDEQERADRVAAAAQFFPEEEDDDEPVLGDKGEGDRDGKNKRRRRRRGRGRDRVEGEDTARADGTASEAGAPAEESARYTGEAPSAEAMDAVATEEELPADTAPERSTSGGEESGSAPSSEENADESGRFEGRRDDRRFDDRRDGRRFDDRRPEDRRDGRREERRPEERRFEERREERTEPRREERVEEVRPGSEELGRDAADLLVSLLARREDRQPVPLRVLIDEALRSGRLNGDPNLLGPALSAAARADTARRESRGERARLRMGNGRIGLVDWSLGPELVRAESDALIAIERLRDAARRHVLRRMNELPQPGFTELMVLLLERIGISGVRSARRPGLPTGELHLSGIARRAAEEQRVAVLVKRGGELGRERVIELRGSPHHYNNPAAIWMITTGNVLSGAREEAAQGTSIPVTLVDGIGLARLFDEHAVGVRHATISIPYPDAELLDTLRGF